MGLARLRPPPTAKAQVTLIGAICFCCPGIYNAVTAMAGGIADPEVNNAANAVLYATFAIFSMLAPAVCGQIGVRRTLFAGTLGYTAFVVSLLGFREGWFGGGVVVAAAGCNGISAALLWTAQGQLCLAYPTRDTKGTYFAIFWCMFNVGGVVGGLITFATNYDDGDAAAASPSTYIAFIAVMLTGTALVPALHPPESVQRSDGSAVLITPPPALLPEIKATLSMLADGRVAPLLPMYLYSNWFFGYQFGVFNAGLFNARTQGWNTAFYWGAEMVGAMAIGRFLDSDRCVGPRGRALAALGVLFVYVNATWVAGLAVLSSAAVDRATGIRTPRLDWTDQDDTGPFLLYFAWGLVDLTIASWLYWVLGQLTDNLGELGRLVGCLKAVQAAGAAMAWALGDIEPRLQLYVNWALFTVAAMGAARVAVRALPATTVSEAPVNLDDTATRSPARDDAKDFLLPASPDSRAASA